MARTASCVCVCVRACVCEPGVAEDDTSSVLCFFFDAHPLAPPSLAASTLGTFQIESPPSQSPLAKSALGPVWFRRDKEQTELECPPLYTA